MIALKGFKQEDTGAEFRLYRDEQVSMMSNPIMNVQAQDPAMDFDCPTETEQAESSVRAMDASLSEALQQYEADKNAVFNFQRYQKRKAESA